MLACDKTPRQQLDEEVLDLERMGATLHVGDGYLDGVQADVVFRTPGMHPDIPALRQLRESGAVVTSEMEAFSPSVRAESCSDRLGTARRQRQRLFPKF